MCPLLDNSDGHLGIIPLTEVFKESQYLSVICSPPELRLIVLRDSWPRLLCECQMLQIPAPVPCHWYNSTISIFEDRKVG